MIALEITDVKDFMNKLLRSDMFDHFLLQEAAIVSGASYVIDGRINRSFYSKEEMEELQIVNCSAHPFSMLRTQCFDLMKGKRTPSSFRFVFMLSPENLKRTLQSMKSSFTEQDITGIFLNIKYQNQLLTITTGVSYSIFSPDKSLENEWDRLLCKFLHQHEIIYEELI